MTSTNDVVGRFRSGYQIDDRPAALTEWRITTGDPEVAYKVHDLLGGDAPQEWAAKGEDNLEVFTASKSVAIILDGPNALRQRMVLWGRSGKPIYTSDGTTKDDGTPDPDADLTFAERKQSNDGIGPVPDIEVFFRLAEESDLGIFKFKTGSWSLASSLAHDDMAGILASVDDAIQATLALEVRSFVARNGPHKGDHITYSAPTLSLAPVGN